MVACHGRRRGVEAVYGTDLGVMMMVRRGWYHGTQGIDPREAFAAQRRWHFGGPVVVRAVRTVDRFWVSERLADEAVQASAEPGFEVYCVSCGVRVARLFPPFRPPVFEPYLR